MDTIVASCTAPGAGALALIRLEGDAARAIAQQMAHVSRGGMLTTVRSHSIVYGFVVDADGTRIDQVLFLVMEAPHTFTGNDVVEITCHNNRFIIQAIISRACELGARTARPGEFTQRAVMNGKMDLLQAEALHELIMAPSRAVATLSLAQLQGSLSGAVMRVQESLFELAAYVEASFEFSEEEHLDLDFAAVVAGRMLRVTQMLDELCAGQKQIQHLREGVRIALVGSVNAGKSTLLNALLGRNRAIVSDIPGTTRDSIEAGVSEGGYQWTYIDTAGLRETDDSIEQLGIVRSRDEAASADVVLFVCDGSGPLSDAVKTEYQQLLAAYAQKLVVVVTKQDKGRHPEAADFFAQSLQVPVSALTQLGMAELKALIFSRVQATYESVDHPFILNQRQLSLLHDIRRLLSGIEREFATGRLPYELLAARLHGLLTVMTELSGRSVTEQVMDLVFSTFCIGK